MYTHIFMARPPINTARHGVALAVVAGELYVRAAQCSELVEVLWPKGPLNQPYKITIDLLRSLESLVLRGILILKLRKQWGLRRHRQDKTPVTASVYQGLCQPETITFPEQPGHLRDAGMGLIGCATSCLWSLFFLCALQCYLNPVGSIDSEFLRLNQRL